MKILFTIKSRVLKQEDKKEEIIKIKIYHKQMEMVKKKSRLQDFVDFSDRNYF